MDLNTVITEYPIYSRTILSHPREEHVGGSHPYKKNKNKCFLGVDVYPTITYNQFITNKRKEYSYATIKKRPR